MAARQTPTRCVFAASALPPGCADMIEAIREKKSAASGTLIGGPLPIERWMSSVFRALRLGRFALLKWRKQIDWNRKKSRGVMFAGNLAHGLQETQLQSNRLLAHHRGRLHHFFRGLKFALGVDDLCAALALGLGLFRHRALHGVGQRHVLYLDRRDFHAP